MKQKMNLRLIPLIALFLLTSILAATSPTSVSAQAPSKISCGGTCDMPGNKLDPKVESICADGLKCMKDPNGLDYKGICVHEVMATCSATNPCCSVTPTVTPVAPTTATKTTTAPISGTPTGVATDQVVGDCSGPTAGVKDGIVSLLDVEYFRKELNKEVSTMACDFDGNKAVDVIDFANYIRIGFAASSKVSTTPMVSSAVPTGVLPTVIITSTVSATVIPSVSPTLPSAQARP